MAITARALLNSALLAAKSVALGADDGALQSQLGDLASVHILKRDLVSVVNGSGLGRASAVHTAKHAAETATETTTAEELGKEILSGHATAASTALEAGLAILIVKLSLLGIGENFVSVRNLLELVFRFGVMSVLVGMVFQGTGLVGLLQLLLGGCDGDL
jgi:hypothetical protein